MGSFPETYYNLFGQDGWKNEVNEGGHELACERALCFGKKIARKGKKKGRERPVHRLAANKLGQ